MINTTIQILYRVLRRLMDENGSDGGIGVMGDGRGGEDGNRSRAELPRNEVCDELSFSMTETSNHGESFCEIVDRSN